MLLASGGQIMIIIIFGKMQYGNAVGVCCETVWTWGKTKKKVLRLCGIAAS